MKVVKGRRGEWTNGAEGRRGGGARRLGEGVEGRRGNMDKWLAHKEKRTKEKRVRVGEEGCNLLRPFVRSLVRSFGNHIHSLACSLVHSSFIRVLVHSFAHSLIRSSINSSIHQFINPLLRSFAPSLLRSFAHPPAASPPQEEHPRHAPSPWPRGCQPMRWSAPLSLPSAKCVTVR